MSTPSVPPSPRACILLVAVATLAAAAAAAGLRLLGVAGAGPVGNGGVGDGAVTWYSVGLLHDEGVIPPELGVGAIAGSVVVTALVVLVLLAAAESLDRFVAEDPSRFDGLRRRLLGANPGSPGGGPVHAAGLFGAFGLGAVATFMAFHGPGRLGRSLLVADESGGGQAAVFLLATMVAGFAVLVTFTEVTHRFDARRVIGGYRFQVQGWTLFVAVGLALVSGMLRLTPPYVLALVAGYVYHRSADDGADGAEEPFTWPGGSPTDEPGSARAVAAGSAAVATLCLVAALIVERLGLPGDAPITGAVGVWIRIAEESVAATVTVAANALVFGLLPFRFAAGHAIVARNRLIWAAGYGVVLLVLVVAPTWAAAVRAGSDATVPAGVIAAVFPVVLPAPLVLGARLWARATRPGAEPSTAPAPVL